MVIQPIWTRTIPSDPLLAVPYSPAPLIAQTVSPLRSIDELIGRADLLRQRKVQLAKTSGLDLSFLTTFAGPSGKSSDRIKQAVHTDGVLLDDRILAEKDVQDAIKNQVRQSYHLSLSEGTKHENRSRNKLKLPSVCDMFPFHLLTFSGNHQQVVRDYQH